MITRRLAALAALAVVSLACAAETPTEFRPALDGGARPSDARVDVGPPRDLGVGADTPSAQTDRGTVPGDDRPVVGPDDVASIYDTGTGTGTDACSMGAACAARPDGCEGRERCGNGLDDNCNGMSDEACPCLPGTVQDCFLGPPGRQGVGQCRAGTQRCQGTGEFGTWTACGGGISPGAETCDNLDNNCDGCVDEGLCCRAELLCPGPGDPRVPDGRPFGLYPLRGGMFFAGDVRRWQWVIRGGPCESVLPRPTFETYGLDTRDGAFRPTLSGDYTITLTVTTGTGATFTCTFVVHVAGPGLRVELCWDTSTTVDVDLYLHDPRNMRPWFSSTAGPLESANNDSCNWSNCEANIRGRMGRVSWGYPTTPVTNCDTGPFGAGWRALGMCSNPRLDIDNNLSKASGVPENVNVDNPRDAETFRIMAQNFTGTAARPVVNVYCGGRLRGTLGAAPDSLPDFTGASGHVSIGAMWRVADVTVRVDASGATTGCEVVPLHPPGMRAGFDVTRNDPRY